MLAISLVQFVSGVTMAIIVLCVSSTFVYPDVVEGNDTIGVMRIVLLFLLLMCYTMVCCVVLCCAMSYCAILHCAALCNNVTVVL